MLIDPFERGAPPMSLREADISLLFKKRLTDRQFSLVIKHGSEAPLKAACDAPGGFTTCL